MTDKVISMFRHFQLFDKKLETTKNIISPDIIELEPYLFLHSVTENILQLSFAYLNDEMLIVFSEKNYLY